MQFNLYLCVRQTVTAHTQKLCGRLLVKGSVAQSIHYYLAVLDRTADIFGLLGADSSLWAIIIYLYTCQRSPTNK